MPQIDSKLNIIRWASRPEDVIEQVPMTWMGCQVCYKSKADQKVCENEADEVRR